MVELGISASNFLKITFLLYGLPAIILITSVIVMELLVGIPILTIFVSFALTGISYIFINKLGVKKHAEGKLMLEVKSVVKNEFKGVTIGGITNVKKSI